jgi:hypothetical protein
MQLTFKNWITLSFYYQLPSELTLLINKYCSIKVRVEREGGREGGIVGGQKLRFIDDFQGKQIERRGR